MILWSEYWFLEMGFVCFLSLVSYLFTNFRLLRSMVSWFLEMEFVCRCHWSHIFNVLDLITAEINVILNMGIHISIYSLSLKAILFIVWSVFCCAGIVINVRPIISIYIYIYILMKMKSKPSSVTYNLLKIQTQVWLFWSSCCQFGRWSVLQWWTVWFQYWVIWTYNLWQINAFWSFSHCCMISHSQS